MNIKSLLPFLFVNEYNCVVCGRELADPTRYRMCSSCYVKLEVVGADHCLKCGRMTLGEEAYCTDCQNHERVFDRALSPLAYSGAAASLVMDLKFHNKRYLAPPMARWMIDRFLQEELTADVVVPVPLHPHRRKQRGYNQSELLAKVIAESLHLPLDTSSVVRVKDTLVSSKLEGGRKAREENMKDAFAWKGTAPATGKTVLVVDDVLTTGTTANEISETLKKAGADKVYVLTFAATREKPPIQAD